MLKYACSRQEKMRRRKFGSRQIVQTAVRKTLNIRLCRMRFFAYLQ